MMKKKQKFLKKKKNKKRRKKNITMKILKKSQILLTLYPLVLTELKRISKMSKSFNPK